MRSLWLIFLTCFIGTAQAQSQTLAKLEDLTEIYHEECLASEGERDLRFEPEKDFLELYPELRPGALQNTRSAAELKRLEEKIFSATEKLPKNEQRRKSHEVLVRLFSKPFIQN